MEVLSRQERREILHALDRADTIQPLQESETLTDTEIELYHVHLPKLEAAGLIEWHRETGEIARGSRYAEVEPFLTWVATHTDKFQYDES
jgi:DNA-binding transcriptional ArsR family regulator